MFGPSSSLRSEQGRLQSLGYVRCSARTMSPASIFPGSPSADPSTGWLHAGASTHRGLAQDSAHGCSPARSMLGKRGSQFPPVTIPLAIPFLPTLSRLMRPPCCPHTQLRCSVYFSSSEIRIQIKCANTASRDQDGKGRDALLRAGGAAVLEQHRRSLETK